MNSDFSLKHKIAKTAIPVSTAITDSNAIQARNTEYFIFSFVLICFSVYSYKRPPVLMLN